MLGKKWVKLNSVWYGREASYKNGVKNKTDAVVECGLN